MAFSVEALPPHFVERDGAKLAYGVIGPEHGETVILVHGLGANGRQFRQDAEYFADRGYRVIVPELRGHGQSGYPPGKHEAGFTVPELGKDIIAIADHLGAKQFHYVGNSLGGVIALWALNEHGDRFQSLTTFGTAYSLNVPTFGIGTMKFFYRLIGPRIVGKVGAIGTTKDKEARKIVREMISEIDIDVLVYIAGHVGKYNFIDNALAYKGPILMLRGELDKTINSALGPTLEAMQGQNHFTLIEVPGGGHCANLDATAQVRADLLTFWNRAAEAQDLAGQ